MNFYGFIALLISIALWVFIIGAVVYAVWTDIKEEKEEEKKVTKKKPSKSK